MKVNAQVDRGIASLVEALNTFPEVRTIESCEGSHDSAWVCFDCGECTDCRKEEWKRLAEFVFGVIGPTLMAEFGDCVELTMSITESGMYRAEMTVAKSVIPAVSMLIRRLPKAAIAA